MNDAGKIAFTPKGEYDSEKTYEKLDVVLYEGDAYVATQLTAGNLPNEENSNYWLPFLTGAGYKDSNDIIVNEDKTLRLKTNFVESESVEELTGTETREELFGKVAKGIQEFIAHLKEKNPHKVTAEDVDASKVSVYKSLEDGVKIATIVVDDNEFAIYAPRELSGALHPMGTVTFSELPSLEDAAESDMYNVSDEFTTTEDFKEGAGNVIPAGANVYKTADNKWDILAGTPVTGVKGEAEENYRTGNVNVTLESLGIGNIDNTADSDKSVKYAKSAGSATTATTATKATQDGNGNVIPDTYATHGEIAKVLEMKYGSGYLKKSITLDTNTAYLLWMSGSGTGYDFAFIAWQKTSWKIVRIASSVDISGSSYGTPVVPSISGHTLTIVRDATIYVTAAVLLSLGKAV